MGMYMIWKDGKCIENGFQNLKIDCLKKRTKSIGGQVLHLVNGEVVNVYHNRNNRMTFSHTFIRER